VTTQTEINQRNHHRAVRFFWALLIGATLVSLTGNITHAVLPYIPHVAIQIGTAAVPPVALLAAVHGIALAVRAGASGRVYCWAVGAVAAIGVGAFAVSFLALRDLMQAIGYSATTAWLRSGTNQPAEPAPGPRSPIHKLPGRNGCHRLRGGAQKARPERRHGYRLQHRYNLTWHKQRRSRCKAWRHRQMQILH
jgi:hypothetical protein